MRTDKKKVIGRVRGPSEGATIEAGWYREEVERLKADPIVAAMAREIPAAMVVSESFEWMTRCSDEYRRRGGTGQRSMGGVVRAVLALRAPGGAP